MSPKSASPKAPAKKAKKAKAPASASAKSVKALEARVDKLVAVISNRLGFNPEEEAVDIIETGDQGESTSAPADEAPAS